MFNKNQMRSIIATGAISVLSLIVSVYLGAIPHVIVNILLVSIVTAYIIIVIYILLHVTNTSVNKINEIDKNLSDFSFVLSSLSGKLETFENNLLHVAKHAGLRVEFIEDEDKASSYRRSTELIKKAEFSLIFVTYWEPLVQSHMDDAREEYFDAIIEQIKMHKNMANHNGPFHARIVQLPKQYESKALPFEIDKPFLKYVKALSELQKSYPRACVIRKATTRIQTNFIIVDQKYIIMPITTPSEHEHQIRYGALIFEDNQGYLVKCLSNMYRVIDANAHPIAPDELKTF